MKYQISLISGLGLLLVNNNLETTTAEHFSSKQQSWIPRHSSSLVLSPRRHASSFSVLTNNAIHDISKGQEKIINNNNSYKNSLIQKLRGGACSDTDPALFVKVGIAAAVETALMLGLLVGSTKHFSNVEIPLLPSQLLGLAPLQYLSLFTIIFASSFLGSVVDGSLSAATRQVLDPNVTPGDPNWYDQLIKPSWNPPGWVFPIMWLIVSKPTQFMAVSKILKLASAQAAATDLGVDSSAAIQLPLPALVLYCSHLALGDAWNKVFFGFQCVGRGMGVITVFYGLLLASAYAFYQVEPQAGYLLLPTCGWVTIATALNWNIFLNNKSS